MEKSIGNFDTHVKVKGLKVAYHVFDRLKRVNPFFF